MEQKDKFQKKFSHFRQGVASRSPANKSKSNSMIRGTSCSRKNKVKEVKDQRLKQEKKSLVSKHRVTNMATQSSNCEALLHDLQLQLSTLKSTLKHLPINTTIQITNYYQIVKQFIMEMVSSPMYNIMKLIHAVYTAPLPTIISRNEFNTKSYIQQPDPIPQAPEITLKSKSSLNNCMQISRTSSKMLTTNPSSRAEPEFPNPQNGKESTNKKLGVKLDMMKIQQTKGNVKDYFDQFYDNIEEFSESWREQALKQRR